MAALNLTRNERTHLYVSPSGYNKRSKPLDSPDCVLLRARPRVCLHNTRPPRADTVCSGINRIMARPYIRMYVRTIC